MFKNMSWEQMWGGVIRHVLTFGGGFLVSMGYLDDSAMMELVGAIGTVMGFVWSFLHKNKPNVLG